MIGMSIVQYWLHTMRAFNQKVINSGRDSEVTLSVNLIRIHATQTVAMTVTLMDHGRIGRPLTKQQFAIVIKSIERVLRSVKAPLGDHCVTMVGEVSPSVYQQMGIHRIFFVPVDSVKQVLHGCFDRGSCLYTLLSSGIDSIYIRTESEGNQRTHLITQDMLTDGR